MTIAIKNLKNIEKRMQFAEYCILATTKGWRKFYFQRELWHYYSKFLDILLCYKSSTKFYFQIKSFVFLEIFYNCSEKISFHCKFHWNCVMGFYSKSYLHRKFCLNIIFKDFFIWNYFFKKIVFIENFIDFFRNFIFKYFKYFTMSYVGFEESWRF